MFPSLTTPTLFILAIGGLLAACQPAANRQQADETDLPAATPMSAAVALPATEAAQWKTVFDAYLAVKDGFVQSDTGAVNRAAATLRQAVAGLSPTGAEAAARWLALRPLLDRTTTTLQAVPELAGKRAAFEDLSKMMLEGVGLFGASGPVYKQYCPMALDDKGAFWLSTESRIRNPYFGDQMLECGEVQQVLEF